jgi:hypothetical protein
MIKWMLLMLAAALVSFSGCSKSEAPKSEPVADTAMVLPEAPELEPLEEEYPEPEAESEPVRKANPQGGVVKDGAYTLQVGIYNNERQAQKRAEKLKSQGFPAYVAWVVDPTPELPGTYYRVRIGSFASTKAARAYGELNLAPQGIEYWADLKARDTEPVNQVFRPQPLPPKPAVVPAPAPAPVPAYEPPPTPAPAATEPPPAEPVPAQPPSDTQPTPKLPDW